MVVQKYIIIWKKSWNSLCKTYEAGRVNKVSGELKLEAKDRNVYQQGKKIEVDIKSTYDFNNKRPKRFLVEYKISNEPTVQMIFNN